MPKIRSQGSCSLLLHVLIKPLEPIRKICALVPVFCCFPFCFVVLLLQV
nr:MAG TPA: hypothetical protein [Caudoviricetes sp.]